jgi:UDPglucose 6-dehydrogenase
MNIAVVGTGYVGLVTGVVLADRGYEVRCVDRDRDKIETLQSGKCPIYEPGVEELIVRGLAERRLSFTMDLPSAARWADIIFIAVGTPPKDNGDPDLSQIEEAAREIGRNLDGYTVVANKSTVPVGTGEWLRHLMLEEGASPDSFDVASNPEFLREGCALQDTLHPDRIIIGASHPKPADKLIEVYAPMNKPVLVTDLASAEMIKYASNAFLAVKISFINAIAEICERCGADVTVVAKGMGADRRIGPAFLHAGLGWGGSCLPKDVQALIAKAESLGYSFGLLRETHRINDQQPLRFVQKVERELGSLDGAAIAVLGLAFKPDTDDLRFARSIEVVKMLVAKGASIRAYDPVAADGFRQLFPDLTYCQDAYEAAEGADAVLLVTEWNEFRQLDLSRLRAVVRRPYLFDGRNVYDPLQAEKAGFAYYGIGRPAPDKVGLHDRRD